MSSAEFTWNPGALPRMQRSVLVPVAEGAARILVNEIKAHMEDAPPRTGRIYLVPGTQTPYTASAPGEPPAVRTGAYRDSWEPTKAVVRGDRVSAAAVSAMRDDHGDLLGLSLEYGRHRVGEAGARTAGLTGAVRPRPHIRPALEAAKPKILAFVSRFGRAA